VRLEAAKPADDWGPLPEAVERDPEPPAKVVHFVLGSHPAARIPLVHLLDLVDASVTQLLSDACPRVRYVELSVNPAPLIGARAAEDIVDEATGEVICEEFYPLDAGMLARLAASGVARVRIADMSPWLTRVIDELFVRRARATAFDALEAVAELLAPGTSASPIAVFCNHFLPVPDDLSLGRVKIDAPELAAADPERLALARALEVLVHQQLRDAAPQLLAAV
jgi:hypothetical protein